MLLDLGTFLQCVSALWPLHTVHFCTARSCTAQSRTDRFRTWRFHTKCNGRNERKQKRKEGGREGRKNETKVGKSDRRKEARKNENKIGVESQVRKDTLCRIEWCGNTRYGKATVRKHMVRKRGASRY